MSAQDGNERASRVFRVSKDVAQRLDAYAAGKGLTFRQVVDAVLRDFLEAHPNVQDVSLSRWIARALVEPPRSRREARGSGPASLEEWKRMCASQAPVAPEE